MLLTNQELRELDIDTASCRTGQIELLEGYFNAKGIECPTAILVHGPASSGKSHVVEKYLNKAKARYGWVNCDQCATTRILLQRALRQVKGISSYEDPAKAGTDIMAENFSSFTNAVEHQFQSENALKPNEEPYFLVLDRVDCLPDDQSDIYHCFSRINELSPGEQLRERLVTIFIISTLEPKALLTTKVPHISFQRYSKSDCERILNMHTPWRQQLLSQISSHTQAELDLFWSRYVGVISDTLTVYAGGDIRELRETIKKLWPVFVRPVLEGRASIKEFRKIYSESERVLGSEQIIAGGSLLVPMESQTAATPTDLPFIAKYILFAAYLASYNPPRFDIRFFSKAKEARAKRRVTQRRKSLKINPRLLAAPIFDFERMLAILQSIVPDDYEALFKSNVDLGAQIATLTILRLIERTSTTDPLDSRTRWRVRAGWPLIKQMATSVKFPIEDYLLE